MRNRNDRDRELGRQQSQQASGIRQRGGINGRAQQQQGQQRNLPGRQMQRGRQHKGQQR